MEEIAHGGCKWLYSAGFGGRKERLSLANDDIDSRRV
jgi:hypothetical protein